MSSEELQANGGDQEGAHHAAVPADATIKFYRSDLTLKGHKSVLITGSTFFSDHFSMHPTWNQATAPKDIRPGVNIKPETMQTVISYLHGSEITDSSIAKNDIPLLLAARAFGIASLEERVKEHLTQKLDHQFELITSEVQIIELATALRELYGQLGGEVSIGKEVVGVVASTTAHACCRKLATLKKSPEFMALLKEIPQLAYDILASDVEVDTMVKKDDSIVRSQETVKSAGDLEQEISRADGLKSFEGDDGVSNTGGTPKKGEVTQVVEDAAEETT